jgi:hypothetical protein
MLENKDIMQMEYNFNKDIMQMEYNFNKDIMTHHSINRL